MKWFLDQIGGKGSLWDAVFSNEPNHTEQHEPLGPHLFFYVGDDPIQPSDGPKAYSVAIDGLDFTKVFCGGVVTLPCQTQESA